MVLRSAQNLPQSYRFISHGFLFHEFIIFRSDEDQGADLDDEGNNIPQAEEADGADTGPAAVQVIQPWFLIHLAGFSHGHSYTFIKQSKKSFSQNSRYRTPNSWVVYLAWWPWRTSSSQSPFSSAAKLYADGTGNKSSQHVFRVIWSYFFTQSSLSTFQCDSST